MPHDAFNIEPIRKYLVGYKPEPNRPHWLFDHNSKGFLVTGYADGSDWLVSPLGREVYGHIFRDRPKAGWALAADRRIYHRLHLYILDFPAKSFREVRDILLTREFDAVDYDGERLVFVCPPAAAQDSHAREIVIVDVASARIVDRFVLQGLTHLFSSRIGRTPDGWLVASASRLNERDERLGIHGLVRFHPLTREVAFEVFPHEGYEPFTISPAGRYVLKASRISPSVSRSALGLSAAAETDGADILYQRSIEVWAGNPLTHFRTVPLDWSSTDEPWKMPWSVQSGAILVWQADEAAFWWDDQKRVICVGMDGRSSPPIRLNTYGSIVTALPDRQAALTFERETTVDRYFLDGSPSSSLMTVDAPAPTVIMPSAADIKRQRNAQAALKKIVSAKSDLRFSVKTSGEQDIVAAIDAITSALEKGLGWFADKDGMIRLAVKIAGVTYDAKRFFALVETLGLSAVHALTRLLARCRADVDFPRVWSGELEDGQQAFGEAARALGGIDPGTWTELAEYEKCIDDSHELYFRSEVIPHFLKSHGWCDESFALVLADIVQVRSNLGDDFIRSWRGNGLAAAAEAKYTPAMFAALMLDMRDRMLCSVAGSFAVFAARVAAVPAPPAHGWCNYDRLFEQIKPRMNPWETRVFEELRLRSGH